MRLIKVATIISTGVATTLALRRWLSGARPRRARTQVPPTSRAQERWEGEGGATTAGPHLSDHDPPRAATRKVPGDGPH